MAGLIKREDIDAVRERARIEDVVGEHVTLKSGGVGSLKGLCPFHDERTPSFNVRPQLGLWHCFGCGEGGDVIDFVQKINHLSFTEAVEYLAGRVGVQLRYEEGGTVKRGVEPGTRQRLLEANRLAEAWFQEQLATPAAQVGRDFLTGRGFDRNAAAHFGVGYAPDGWDNLANMLRSHGFTERELVESGLCGRGNSGRIYDRFRDRLIWPIHDVTGAPVGFGGRRLSDADKTVPKYLNTPETAIYHKGQVLYGLDLAKSEIARAHQIVVVEGYTDVMAAHLSGVPTAVATCGTAFGPDHVRIVRRLLGDAADPSAGVIAGNRARGGEIIFTFDGDVAGQKAALRAYGEDQHFAAQTFVAVEPRGLDPCDLRMEEGPDAIPRLLGRRVPLFEFVIRASLANLNLDTAEGRVQGLRSAAPVVAGIRDRALKREYTRRLAGWLGLPESEAVGAVRASERRGMRPGGRADGAAGEYGPGDDSLTAPTAERPGLPPVTDPVEKLERRALEVIVQMPQIAARVGADDINAVAFSVPVHRAVFEAIEAAGGATEVDGLVQQAQAAGLAAAEAVKRATTRWLEQVRAGAIGPVAAAVTELAVAPLPLPAPRGNRESEPDSEALERYAAGILSSLARTGINRRLTQLRSRQRRMDPNDAGYRELFEEIVGLENRRMQMARQG
ncbi:MULTISPECIES: DNA primase [unclassified Actinomyces]|uniref:DNA primase n=1 Tax=unclassified Actinomyces TaxID=2609248 RepID=UPI0013A68C6E|nr:MULTISPECIES: DNA primase [unclassified Actinomyces]MBW3069181.1 DNA primase [Actinomyces sp. 594]NDR54580.1 DNA primase [Actinomyces sp. 565]